MEIRIAKQEEYEQLAEMKWLHCKEDEEDYNEKILDGVDRAISMTEFVKMCCEAGVYSELRRGGYLLAQVLREHNDKYLFAPC